MPASIPPSTLEKFSTFGDLLRYLRRRTGITRMELSIAVGYSDAQISRLEQNLRLPDIPTKELFMKTIQYLAASLLLLTGALHVGQVMTSVVMSAAEIITLIFGIIYLALGLLLYRGGRVVYWFAAVIPLVGLLLAGVGMLADPTIIGAIFMAIDVAIAACCFTLLLQKRHRMVKS